MVVFLCVCVCVCVHASVCARVCTSVCACMCVCMCVLICLLSPLAVLLAVCAIEFPSILRDSLEVLFLNDNHLECVPASLCGLVNLSELYLSK